ncbi:MAG: hypothetical protein H6742_14610 [Alphaproteobacteria bacterium]|nr:hypothetical protein [Alphaproteobacteria bacterium]
MLLLLACTRLALAGPAPPWAEPDEVLVVTAERDLAEARQQVEATLGGMDFGRMVQRDGRTVFRRARLWKARAVFHHDGWLEVKAPLATPQLLGVRPLRTGDGQVVGHMVEVHGRWSGGKVASAQEARVVYGAEDALRVYRTALQRRSLALHRTTLRQELVAAWYEGRSPDGALLPSPEARRAFVLDRWLQTADNDAGAALRADIEVFIDDVVQPSDTPLTAAEIAAANDARAFAGVLAPAR